MKAAIRCITFLLLCQAVSADIRHLGTKTLYPSAYGTRGSSNLTNLISKVGTNDSIFVMDQGVWNITQNVTFPQNIGVMVQPGCHFNIYTNIVLAFETNSWLTGPWTAFAGPGTASGECTFVYRFPEWGSTSQYDIGEGYITNYAAISALRDLMVAAVPDLDTNKTDNVLTNTLATWMVAVYPDLDTNQTDKVTTNSIGTDILNVFPSMPTNSVVLTNDVTVAIDTNMTMAEIRDLADDYSYIDYGVTLTFDFADGLYTISEGFDCFAGYAGPGDVHVIGNTADHSLCSIYYATNTLDGIFEATDGGRIDLLDGFTIYSYTNGSSVRGLSVNRQGFIETGSNILIHSVQYGIYASSGATVGAQYITISNTIGNGFFVNHHSQIDATYAVAKNCAGDGYAAQGHSYIYALGAVATNCDNGFYAFECSSIGAPSSVALGNTDDYNPNINTDANGNSWIRK